MAAVAAAAVPLQLCPVAVPGKDRGREEPVVLAQESVELGAEGGGSGAVDAAAKRASAKANRHLEATATYKAISEVSVAVQYAWV